MAHERVPEAEEHLDTAIPVLDHGFVRLVDYMGGDARVVQSARVSYGAGTKTYREDRGLIRYLLRNEHTSPFEQVILTFHTKMPIFVARQWVRHRTARLNEISGRYSILPNEFYVPHGQAIAPQSDDNKQGRAATAFDPAEAQSIAQRLAKTQTDVYEHYQGLIDQGVARELARINLPLSTYTEWYWQIDLHNLMHFLKLRMDTHAQFEIREYAKALNQLARAVAPICMEAFDDFVLSGVRLSGAEVSAVADLVQRTDPELWSEVMQHAQLSKRERELLTTKLARGQKK